MIRQVKLLAPIRWNGPANRRPSRDTSAGPWHRIQGEAPSGLYEVIAEEPEGGVLIDCWAGFRVSLHASEFVRVQVTWT